MKLKVDANGNAVLIDGKPVYVHDDGKEIPFDAAGAVAKISALNHEAKTHREGKESAEAKLAAFDGITDPAAAKKALETVKNFDDKKLVEAGEVEKVKAEAIKSVKAEYEPIVAERDKLRGDLNTEIIGGAFARSKFITEKMAIPADLVQSYFGSAFTLKDRKIVAKHPDGREVFSRVRHGEPADFDEAIEQLVDGYAHKAHILKGSGASGGGAGPSGGAVKKKLSEMSETERVQLYNTNKQEFERLKKEAA